eukprot:8781665-Pyramimonas_sp.AAC.1
MRHALRRGAAPARVAGVQGDAAQDSHARAHSISAAATAAQSALRAPHSASGRLTAGTEVNATKVIALGMEESDRGNPSTPRLLSAPSPPVVPSPWLNRPAGQRSPRRGTARRAPPNSGGPPVSGGARAGLCDQPRSPSRAALAGLVAAPTGASTASSLRPPVGVEALSGPAARRGGPPPGLSGMEAGARSPPPHHPCATIGAPLPANVPQWFTPAAWREPPPQDPASTPLSACAGLCAVAAAAPPRALR